jgi:hypothetical protein
MTLHQKLEKLEQVVLRARAHFDIWWIYAGADTRPRLLPTMNDFSEFFRFDEHAHQFTFVVYLHQLLDQRAKTINLRAVIAEAQAANYRVQAIERAATIVTQMEPVWKKLVILRSNLFAHRSDQLAWNDAFSKAHISTNEIRTFTEQGLAAVHALLDATGSHLNHFGDLPQRDVLRLFEGLGGRQLPSRSSGPAARAARTPAAERKR